MRTLRFPRGFASILCALALAPLAHADTIVLKTGEKIEGKVVQETDQELLIEYNVTATIKDTRTVPKAEVEKVEKEAPDLVAFAQLKQLKPGPNGYPAETYDRILKALQGFIDQYPKSAHVEEIRKQLEAFTEEKKRIAAGELKFGGEWLTKEEAQKERYQLSGKVLLSQMQEAAQRGDYVGAMNVFDQLEKNYPGSHSFPDAIDLARQILPNLKTTADRTLDNWKVKKVERDKGTQLSSPTEKEELLAAQKREQQANDAALEAADKGRVKWAPFLATSEKSLTVLSTAAVNEQRRLETLPVAKMRQSIATVATAKEELEKEEKADPAVALAAVRDAIAQWPQNEVATRLSKTLADQANAPKATPMPEATPAATPVATPAPATSATPLVAATPRPTPNAAQPTVAPVAEEAPNFFLTPAGGVTVIVLLGLIFGAYTAYKKVKSKADAVIE